MCKLIVLIINVNSKKNFFFFAFWAFICRKENLFPIRCVVCEEMNLLSSSTSSLQWEQFKQAAFLKADWRNLSCQFPPLKTCFERWVLGLTISISNGSTASLIGHKLGSWRQGGRCWRLKEKPSGMAESTPTWHTLACSFELHLGRVTKIKDPREQELHYVWNKFSIPEGPSQFDFIDFPWNFTSALTT